MEELIADLTSCFLCADLQIQSEPRLDHAPYLSSWLKVMRADKKAIFTAASKAQEGATYLQQLAALAGECVS